jgi:hypothetical protein
VRRLIPSRILRLFLLVGVALALLGMVTGRAEAATPDRVVLCGGTVTWGVSSWATPAEVHPAVAAAWEQVAPLAGITAVNVEEYDADVRWSWIDRGTGSRTPAGTSQRRTLLGDRVYTEHAHLPGVTGPDLRQAVLLDVLRDLGLSAPTSTGGTVSPEDAQQIQALCESQAADPANPADTVDDEADDADAAAEPVVEDDGEAGAPAAPVTAPVTATDNTGLPRAVGYAAAALALLGVGGYLLAPGLLARRRQDDSAEATA